MFNIERARYRVLEFTLQHDMFKPLRHTVIVVGRAHFIGDAEHGWIGIGHSHAGAAEVHHADIDHVIAECRGLLRIHPPLVA